MDAERRPRPDRPDGRRHPPLARGDRERPRRRGSGVPSGSASGRTSSTRRASSCSVGRSSTRRRRGERRRCPPGRDILSRCVTCASAGPPASVRARSRPRARRRAARRACRGGPAAGRPAERAGGRRSPERACRRDRRPRAPARGRPRADRPLRARRAADARSTTRCASSTRPSAAKPVDDVLTRFAAEFGPEPGRADLLESLLLLDVAAENPAATPLRPARRPGPVARAKAYDAMTAAIERLARRRRRRSDGGGETLVGDAPRAGPPLPHLARRPAPLRPRALGAAILPRATSPRGCSPERTSSPRRSARSTSGSVAAAAGPSRRRRSRAPTRSRSASATTASGCRGSSSLAKSTYVWLDQLSRRYGRDIRTLDAIPDEELDTLARRGITGLWLIGLWQRSRASERIKRWRGNQEAVASAYSLDDYRIADDLGGEAALTRTCATGPRPAGSGSRATWSRTTWGSTRAG